MVITLTSGLKGQVLTNNQNEIDFDQDGVIAVFLDDNTVFYATSEDIVVEPLIITLDIGGDEWTFKHNRSAIMDAKYLERKGSMVQLRSFLKKYKVECKSEHSKRHWKKAQLMVVAGRIGEIDLFLSNSY